MDRFKLKIESIDQELAAADPNNYELITELYEAKKKQETDLEESEMLWMENSEKAEEIISLLKEMGRH